MRTCVYSGGKEFAGRMYSCGLWKIMDCGLADRFAVELIWRLAEKRLG